jgi:diguanylate cyclase (GGDEF)-like protein/PAS domain S-box-containing protein
MIGTVHDITDSVIKEEKLRATLDEALLFRELLDKSNDAIYIFDLEEGRLTDCNGRALEMLGYTRDELLALRVRDIEITCREVCDWKNYIKRLHTGTSWTLEGVHRRKDGTTFPAESSISLTKNGTPRVIAIVRDISERKTAEEELLLHREHLEELVEKRTEALRNANKKLETYLQVVDNNVLTSSTDTEGVITYVSDAFCQTSGYTKEELLGSQHNIIRHPDMPSELFEEMWGTITEGAVWKGELKNQRRDGSDLWVKMTIEPNFDETDTIIGYTAIRHDISDKKRIEELTQTDPLTGIYNRRFFYEIMDKELRRTARYGGHLCFAMIDIDFFKNYNDTYGHLEGDKVLLAVSKKIKSLMRRGDDYLFRLGGEEFGIVCHCRDEGMLLGYAEMIRREIEGMKIIHEQNDISDYVTISMGVTVIPSNRLLTLDEVYEKADRALYRAKDAGRNRTIFLAF